MALRSKKIRIVSDKELYALGGIRGPIRNWYRERMDTIKILVRDGYYVEEMTPDGQIIKLTMDNFDKENGGTYDDEDKIKSTNKSTFPLDRYPEKTDGVYATTYEQWKPFLDLENHDEEYYMYKKDKYYDRGSKAIFIMPDGSKQLFLCKGPRIKGLDGPDKDYWTYPAIK